MRLEAVTGRPEAIGEGRSSFAGVLLAVALGCLLLQDPIALQPGLNFMLAIGWTIAALGRLVQMLFDGGLSFKHIQARFFVSLVLAALAWNATEFPYMACFESFRAGCGLPVDASEWFLTLVALLTVSLGVIALFLPGLALKILRLQPIADAPFAMGETRGTLAGFYMAIGAVYLLMPQPIEFVALVMGAAWLLTGAGRIVSMFFDRGWTVFNVLGTVFEVGIGLLVVMIVLGII